MHMATHPACLCLNMQAHFGGDPTDALFVPSRLSSDFVHATTPFLQEELHHEQAVPAILGIIAHDTDDFQVCIVVSELLCVRKKSILGVLNAWHLANSVVLKWSAWRHC